MSTSLRRTKINILLDRLARAIMKPIGRGVAAFIAIYTIVWGLWLVSPFWDVFTSASLYSGLANFGGELFWGIIAVFCGSFSLYSIVKRMPKTIFTGAALTGWMWLTVSILYFYGDWHNTGGITALFLAWLCAYLYLNARANQGYR